MHVPMCVLWPASTRNVRSVLMPKLRQERHVYSRQTPHAPFLLFFSGAAPPIACTPSQLMKAPYPTAAAAPLKNKRIIVGRLSYKHGAPDGAWATNDFGK